MHKHRLWGGVGIAAVSLTWLVSATANGWAGYHLSDTWELGAILAAASVAADVMKVVALFVISAAITNRRWVAVCVAVVVFVLCAGWSMRSATDFAATIFYDRVAEKNFRAEAQQTAKDILDLRKKRAEFLSRQTVVFEGNGKTKGRAVRLGSDEIKPADTEFGALLRDLDKGAHDLHAAGAKTAGDPLAELLGIEHKKLILITALGFALILEIVSGVGFWMIDQARLQPEVKPQRISKPRKTNITQPPPPVAPGPDKARAGLGPMTRTVNQGGFGAPLSAPSPEPAPASNVVMFPDLAPKRCAKVLQCALNNPLARDVPEPLSKRYGGNGAERSERDETSPSPQSRRPIPAPPPTNGKYKDGQERDTRSYSPLPPNLPAATAHIAAFEHECLEQAPGMSVWASELRASYERWCQRHGYKPLSSQKFGMELQRLGYEKWKSCGRMRYRNLQLRS